MDELELLKKDWKRQEATLPHVNASDIYKMILKTSSSLTKWILIIAILEFVFWIALTILSSSDDYFDKLRKIHFYQANIYLSVVHYCILAFFIYWFYKNYKKIKVTDDIKLLMTNILKVRKTVNYYVIYNLGMSFVIAIMYFVAMAIYDPAFNKLWAGGAENSLSHKLIVLGAITLFLLVLLVILWLFYKLLYGILLRRLHRNYKELNKLELRN
ncbi:hypothetical protein ACH3O9_00365 [Leeuwenhoekiella sp. A16]|uniref:hypothetical protein n=1 Tax=unclassified Leeuwenhoekiella TaxID=2615029 RepID=UPI003A7F8FD3